MCFSTLPPRLHHHQARSSRLNPSSSESSTPSGRRPRPRPRTWICPPRSSTTWTTTSACTSCRPASRRPAAWESSPWLRNASSCCPRDGRASWKSQSSETYRWDGKRESQSCCGVRIDPQYLRVPAGGETGHGALRAGPYSITSHPDLQHEQSVWGQPKGGDWALAPCSEGDVGRTQDGRSTQGVDMLVSLSWVEDGGFQTERTAKKCCVAALVKKQTWYTILLKGLYAHFSDLHQFSS